MKHIKNILLNTFNFKGRTGRKEYWTYLVCYYITQILLGFVLGIIGGRYLRVNNLEPDGLMFENVYLYFSIFLTPMISATVRRLRDAGLSPWLLFLPLLNIILCLKPSSEKTPDLK